jgi:hypothetical protein
MKYLYRSMPSSISTSCTGSVHALGPYVGDTKHMMVSEATSYLPNPVSAMDVPTPSQPCGRVDNKEYEPWRRSLERLGKVAEGGAQRAQPGGVDGGDALHVGLLGEHQVPVDHVLLVLAEEERGRVHVDRLVGLDGQVLEVLVRLRIVKGRKEQMRTGHATEGPSLALNATFPWSM